MPTSRRVAGPVASAGLLVALSSCGDGGAGEVESAASCAMVIVYDGHSYLSSGDVRRDPEPTGRSWSAVIPGCDDGGGQTGPEHVRVEELVDVPAATAVLFDGSVYVRDGRDLPPATKRWFRAPSCDTEGTFELTGDWLGVTGQQPRFDGDIRPPYRLKVHVTSGPSRYVGATIMVRATQATDPDLAAADVKESLWRGGQVTAAVRCSDEHFEAVALRT